jgi:cytochrome P450 / NADPH-cytochrome P450 reductase
MAQQIPAPRGLPIIGNLLELQEETPPNALDRLADIYGPIFKLTVLGQERYFISSAALFEDL